MKIETICADSNNKTEAYRLLVMVHTMAIRCAHAKTDGWFIRSGCTDNDYVSTVVSNGIVNVTAVTLDGKFHTYSMGEVTE